ncbi:dephospho-CoA kinase [candidate division KSB1 bacterium]|nr:dephospho-CoA kinase [candidate division KSB1 bacterium]RQV99880.1 MAG: dephospho-CoA kinase [candidate division KSB1 bacterium]
MRKLIVGLTGVLGSGKSSAAMLLAKQGACIVDMDDAGRWVVEHDAQVLDNIRRVFGPDVFDHHQKLLRKKLGDIIFSDAHALAQLNSIVHPAMLKRVRALVEKEKKQSLCLYIVVDAALIFELGFEKECDVSVTIAAPLEQCLQRAREKNLTRLQALDRIKSQLSQDEKIARADYVIYNDASLEEFQQRVHDLHAWLLNQAEK